MGITYKEGVPAQIRRLRKRQKELWKPHDSLRAFLEDWFPDEWDRVQRCTYSARIFEAQDGSGRMKVSPECCHAIPFCIGCNKRMAYRRMKAAMDKFHRTTPAGKQPAFVHVVQTAPLKDEHGEMTGWGLKASQDVEAFFRVVTKSLKEIYGDGIGAVGSYQDFGERGFAKRHPHLDLTLNGWMFQNDEAVEMPRFNLKDGGRDKWDAIVQNNASVFEIDAWRGNVGLSGRIVGVKAYWKALKYQMRELVDFRKIEYDAGNRVVYWKSYRDSTRTSIPVNWFMNRFEEYQARLGRWGKYQTRHLHRSVGFMSDRKIGQSQKAMGGQVPGHGSACPCNQCGDWAQVPLSEIERWLGSDAI